ncbi:MAG TPA: hypothetical protein ENN21_04255 [Spirochaetes bacterium]|nr:hypothetical protein [Spirochaetota bacterium]
MDNNRNMITPEALASFTACCHGGFRSHDSKSAALKYLAEKTTAKLGDFLHAAKLARPDDVSVKFIELLDQVLFEMKGERNGNGGRTEDYIIDDLYGRAEIYLDFFHRPEKYHRGLRSRLLYLDDIVIIGQYRLREYLPLLMTEFHDQPHLRLAIAKALAAFDDESLFNFFYEIANNGFETELKILALLGLKGNSRRFYNWRRLNGQDDPYFQSLILYIAGDGREYERDNPYVLFYRLARLDIALRVEMTDEHCVELMDTLNAEALADMESMTLKGAFEEILSNTLNKIHSEAMQRFLGNGENLSAFLDRLESLPTEVFEKAVVMIGSMNDRLVSAIESLIVKGKFGNGGRSVKLSGYLYAQGVDAPEL